MKYLLSADQRKLIERIIEQKMMPGEFGESSILSLYYDTPEFTLIERSLDKPLYKEKLRLRVYGTPSPLGPAFVELKKKYDGVVYKRRVSLSLAAAQVFLEGLPYEKACRAFPLIDHEAHLQSLSPRSVQIGREIEFTLARHGDLAPSLLTKCDRVAYADPEGSDLRITFDANLDFATGMSDLLAECDTLPLIDPAYSIMEIKNAGPLPFWLLRALSNARAYPRSFSKYGHAYMSLRKDERSA
jgi:SPX domain protein involved in polyphosphate accumulation